MLGVGVDILNISHLDSCVGNPDDPFTRRVYTKAEHAQALEREVPLYYYATRFAGKEAVFKALNTVSDGVNLNEIEILSDGTGRPRVTLSGDMARRAGEAGITEVLLSLSYDTDYAIAYATAK